MPLVLASGALGWIACDGSQSIGPEPAPFQDCGVGLDAGDGSATSCDGSASADGACERGEGGTETAVAIACNWFYTCALLPEGTVKCWGDNGDGELGVGFCPAASSVPLTVSGLAGVKAISAGILHACALLTDGTVKCWGDVPSTGSAFTPNTVPGLTGVAAIAAGNDVDCALLANGTIRCWGWAPWWAPGGRARQRYGHRRACTDRLGDHSRHGVEHQRCHRLGGGNLLDLRDAARHDGPLLGSERVRRAW